VFSLRLQWVEFHHHLAVDFPLLVPQRASAAGRSLDFLF
jgi:hypothetical protein